VDVLPLQPDNVHKQPLGQAVLAHDPGRSTVTLVGQLDVSISPEGQ
jgi:hypothetical protein